MTKADILAQCELHGEFYLYYEKLRSTSSTPGPKGRGKNITYLQGTTEFLPEQDKYLASRLQKEGVKPADKDHILVFSRTSDNFRYIPVSKIQRVNSLNSVLDRATPVRGLRAS